MTREEIIAYAAAHREADVARLLLSAHGVATDDLRHIADQIEGWRTAVEKWPRLSAVMGVWYPPRLNREQSSSEATADYKATLIADGCQMADLTGGMGIDSMTAARKARRAVYVERDATLVETMHHNAEVLHLNNIECHKAESMAWIAAREERYDVLYLDPARRDTTGRRVEAFDDCTPSLLPNLPMLMRHCQRLIVKAAPMIDLHAAERQLEKYLSEVHIVAVRGECKEVLFVCDDKRSDEEPLITCVNISSAGATTPFAFRHNNEAEAHADYSTTIGTYLYEPNAALMKGGAFSLIGKRYGLAKLSRNTHLYTADRLVEEFPGRRFRVVEEFSPTPRRVRELLPEGRAHVVCRNYPVAAAELQRQLRLREGGDLFVVATTIGVRKTALLCEML